jgi:hypothetical protein
MIPSYRGYEVSEVGVTRTLNHTVRPRSSRVGQHGRQRHHKHEHGRSRRALTRNDPKGRDAHRTPMLQAGVWENIVRHHIARSAAIGSGAQSLAA